ncbi:MAG TPA: ArsA-related P-loop ATPase [Acidimicrobiales bacterium]|nr:ArsA-related P-loop ATPase [Acidimicrobiales bacterium]
MEVSQFCSTARLFIVAGKGGVGKTTVTAALARAAAGAGLSALIIEIEGKSGIGSVFGRSDPLTYEEVLLHPGGGPAGDGEVRARTLTPDDALLEYLEDHGMRRVSRRLANSGALDVVATAVPGIKDILVLGKVKQLERAAVADVLIIDAPAAGHAVTFLTSARGLLDAARVGPIRAQAHDVVELLSDPARCQVILVTLPEETPVNEVVETAYTLEDRVGIKLGPVVVNGLYPALDGLDADPAEAARTAGVEVTDTQIAELRAAADFRRQRQELQSVQLARLAETLPLDQLRLPFLFTPEIGPSELEVLSTALAAGIEELG